MNERHHATLVRVSDLTSYTPTEHDDEELVVYRHDRLGIDEARQLADQAHRTPATASVQRLVVLTPQVTVEAQNALLKLFEEPPATTRLQLVLPSTVQLLPTLLSRVSLVAETDEAAHQSWDQFLASSYALRLEQIAAWHKAKDTDWLLGIQGGLLAWLATAITVTPAIALVAERLNTRGASNKMLLELLALELPVPTG